MAHDIRIVKVFREEGVCGATDLENRPALMALLEALVANGTKLVLIEKLELRNLSEINRIYWSEMLFRVRWAAGLNLRHQRWQAGCVDAADSPANFLSFAANLRGLIEASLDANYSLGQVPYALASCHTGIRFALEGKSLPLHVAGEMEDRLSHVLPHMQDDAATKVEALLAGLPKHTATPNRRSGTQMARSRH